jgi:DnaJ-class molecular chaperone
LAAAIWASATGLFRIRIRIRFKTQDFDAVNADVFRSKWVAKKTTAKTKRMSGPSPWDVLGVPENADDRQVRRAYRSLALEFHPDKNSSPQAAAEFRRINEVN